MSEATKQFYHWVMAYRIVTKSPGRRVIPNLLEWIKGLDFSGDKTAICVESLASLWLKECHTDAERDAGHIKNCFIDCGD